ncbi:MAG: hypothetical protein KDE56_19395, partial [Anaerolineales bacterium]|nr:hypothetical protein [Anaerolineales bacterium]
MTRTTIDPTNNTPRRWAGWWRRYQEIKLIGRDPVLAMGLLLVGVFVFLFIAFPLLRVVWQGFFDLETGEVSLEYFGRYI